MNIDVGGQKHRRDLNGKWKTLDSNPNADYYHDLNSIFPFPFEANSIDNIYTSNTLEHVEPANILNVLKEFHRILKSGGKCRIVVPDVRHAIMLYLNNPEELKIKNIVLNPNLCQTLQWDI